MRTQPLRSVFQVKASSEMERLVSDYETLRPETIDAMRLEIRRQNFSQVDALARKYKDPSERIIYRFLQAKEQRLAAILVDNRLLWEGTDAPSK